MQPALALAASRTFHRQAVSNRDGVGITYVSSWRQKHPIQSTRPEIGVFCVSLDEMLFLAMSCLHGRPKQHVADSLLALDIDGLQLTPGCPPDPDFDDWVKSGEVCTVRHHGYCDTSLRQRVWDSDGRCLVSSDSVHPPRRDTFDLLPWRTHVCSGDFTGVLETMYADYALGDGADLEWAMNNRLRLAVDISHMHIQRVQGLVSDKTWERLQNYDRIMEVHVSANGGIHDTHDAITQHTFGLGWAQEKLRSGTRLVLECMMFRMSLGDRREQVALVRNSQ